MAGTPTTIGPFIGGLNTRSDPTAVADNELVVCENFELDLDGSMVSRPPIVDRGVSMPLGTTGNMRLLGYYYAPGSVPYLIGSDGDSSTYYYSGTSWVLITNTISATAMAQFNDQAWLLAGEGDANPGGRWAPSGGFVAEANMPKGEVLVAQKSRLWVAKGQNATSQGTRLYYSQLLGAPGDFWPASPDFLDVGAGDGQNIVQVVVYYNNLLVFRTNSIYTFQYANDPASGMVSLIVPGVGLASKESVVVYENYVYFMYEERAYEFFNNRANHINVKVPFEGRDRTGLYMPFAVSVFGHRIIFSYYDVMFIFSVNTRTWTTWYSQEHGAIGKFFTVDSLAEDTVAVTHSTRSVGPVEVVTNLYANPAFASTGSTVTVRENIALNPRGVAGVGYRANNNEIWAVTKGVAVSGPEGLTTGVQCLPRAAGVTNKVLSMYDLDGLLSSGSPARTHGAWLYVSTEGFEVKLGSLTSTGYTAVPSGWTWVKGTMVPAGEHMVMEVRKIDGSFVGTAEWAVVTGVTALIGPAAPDRAIWGGKAAWGGLSYEWAGAADDSPSLERGQVPRRVSPSASQVIEYQSWETGVRSRRTRVLSYNAFGINASMTNLDQSKLYTLKMDLRADNPAPITPRIQGTRGEDISLLPIYQTYTYKGVPGPGSFTGLVGFGGGWEYGDYIDMRRMLVVEGDYGGGFFDGSTPDTDEYAYAWTGAAHNSPSTMTKKRRARTLFITDAVTNESEQMVCLAQTKNYNYEAASIYKRLFWWGIDAVFRGKVTGLATPITFTRSVMWSQLLGTTWAHLQNFTWSQPLVGTYSEETERDTGGLGAARKFVKFKAPLRFRQIHYSVRFETDGSVDTAPVRLFSLMTYVSGKQVVAKAVT